MKKLDSIPQKGFYENSGLEFDPIDILHREGDGIAMSRWIFSRDGEIVTDDKWNSKWITGWQAAQDAREGRRHRKTGKSLSEASVPAPSWDGLALAQGNLYLTTADGRLLCLGDKETKTASR